MRHKPVPGFVMFTYGGKPLWLKPAVIEGIRPASPVGSWIKFGAGESLVDQPPLIAMRRLKKALEEVPSPAVSGQEEKLRATLRQLEAHVVTARESSIEGSLTSYGPVSESYKWATGQFSIALSVLKEGKETKE